MKEGLVCRHHISGQKISKVQNIFNPLEENCDTDIMSHSDMFLLQIGKREELVPLKLRKPFKAFQKPGGAQAF